MCRAKNDNKELGIHLRKNFEVSEFSENFELSLCMAVILLALRTHKSNVIHIRL